MTLWVLAAWLVSGSISVPLAIFFLFFLGINNQFKYSFYRLVQCDLFLNILTYASTWVRRLCDLEESRPMMVYVFHNYNFIFHVTGFCPYFFFNVQSLSSITLCIHRCTTATLKNANHFWRQYFLVVYIGIVVSSVCLILPQYLLGYITPLVYDEQKGYFLARRNPNSLLVWQFFSIQNKIYFIIIVFCSFLTIVLLKKKFASWEQSARTKQIMMKLALIAIINSLVYLSVVLWQNVASLFFGDLSVEMNTFVLMIASDTLSLSMPYILIFCDKNVKTAIIDRIIRSSHHHHPSIAMFAKRN